MCDMDPLAKHRHFFLAPMFKTPAPQKRLELLDGLMTGTMERYASQPLVVDRFLEVVGVYAKK